MPKKAFWPLTLKTRQHSIESYFGWSWILIIFILSGCIWENPTDLDTVTQTAEAIGIDDESGSSDGKVVRPQDTVVAGNVGCAVRPDPADCCNDLNQDCSVCREQIQVGLEKWRVECLPAFNELKNCDPGVKISTCCGDDSSECVDCRMKMLKLMIEWRQKCNLPDGGGCDKPEPIDDCCKGGDTLCELCQKRVAKLKLDRQRRCGRKSL